MQIYKNLFVSTLKKAYYPNYQKYNFLNIPNDIISHCVSVIG